MRKIAVIAVTALAALVATAVPAAAARPASEAELAAMTEGFAYPELLAAPGCLIARISTVAPSWGTLAVPRDGDCDGFEGLVTTVVRRDGTWTHHRQRLFSDPAVACEDLRMPGAVGFDLGLCSPAARDRLLPCVKPGSATVLLRRRPPTCGDYTQSRSANWELHDIRWTRWGGAEALGRATLPPYRLQGPDDPDRTVHVRAFGVRYSCGWRRPAYSRVRIWAKPTRVRITLWETDRAQWVRLPAYSRTEHLLFPSGCTHGDEIAVQ